MKLEFALRQSEYTLTQGINALEFRVVRRFKHVANTRQVGCRFMPFFFA